MFIGSAVAKPLLKIGTILIKAKFFVVFQIFGGFSLLCCDSTMKVHLCMEDHSVFLIAVAQQSVPQGARRRIKPRQVH